MRDCRGWVLGALVAGWAASGCGGDGGPRVDRATREAARAVEERVGGTFPDYYGEVVSLAMRYGAEPDSFRIALDALPGSHLTEEEWAAWTAPYAEDAERILERLDEATSGPPIKSR